MGFFPLPHPKYSRKKTDASKSMNTEVHALGHTIFPELERAKKRGDPKPRRSQTNLQSY